jgi:hypothetical protein
VIQLHIEERSYIGKFSPRCIVSQSNHPAKPHDTSSEVRIRETDLFGTPFPLQSTLVIDHVLSRVVSHVPSTVLQVCNDLRLQLGGIASGSKTELVILSERRDVASPRHYSALVHGITVAFCQPELLEISQWLRIYIAKQNCSRLGRCLNYPRILFSCAW